MEMEDYALAAMVVVFVAVLLLFAHFMAKGESGECQAKGGHIVSKSSVGPVMGGQGGMTVNTFDFCISKDGRILD